MRPRRPTARSQITGTLDTPLAAVGTELGFDDSEDFCSRITAATAARTSTRTSTRVSTIDANVGSDFSKSAGTNELYSDQLRTRAIANRFDIGIVDPKWSNIQNDGVGAEDSARIIGIDHPDRAGAGIVRKTTGFDFEDIATITALGAFHTDLGNTGIQQR
jgi:hypothetical protein